MDSKGENVLKQTNNKFVAYRRRKLPSSGLLTLLAAGLSLAPLASTAQDTTKPAATQTPTPAVPAVTKQADPVKQAEPPLRVVPTPRRGGQGANKFTITPDAGTGTTAPAGLRGGGGAGGGTPFSFDFRGADITNVLKLYATMSGQTITADSTLSGQVTIINPKPVTLDDAFKILQSVLAVRGFTALQTGSVISIVPFGTGVKSTTLLNADKDGKVDPRNQVMTQIIPLDNVDADALAKDLLPLISAGASLIGSSGSNALILTDSATNVQRFLNIVEALDKSSSNSEMVIYQLKRAEAPAVASVINDLYKQITARGKGGGAAPQPGQPGFNPNQPQQGGGAAARPAVVAVADSRTNSVIVVASRDKQEQIAKELIARLDDDDTNTLNTEFIKIKYADASSIANLVNGVLSNMHGSASATGGGGSSFQSRAFGYDPFGFGGGGGGSQASVTSSDPFGKVVADARTNSLLVTANDERMAKIKALIKQLDVEVHAETTTFVIPLKNAQAADVSAALGQAFGTSQNNQGYGNSYYNFGGGGGNSSSNGTNRTQINRRYNGSSNSTTGRAAQGRSRAPGPPPGPDGNANGDGQGGQDSGSAIPQGIQGVMTPNGFVPTSSTDSSVQGDPTRQYYGYGGRGGGRFGQSSSSSPQYGRGSNGSYVNLLQLQNNVTSTATPNGDSIIITTTPDNIEAVKAIVEQLDVVPRQVMIEVIVAEVTLDSNQKLGFSANGMLNRLFHSATGGNAQLNQPASGFNTGAAGTALDAAAQGFQFVLNNANYSAVVQALDSNNKVKILATPKVFTSNNQQATINIQQQIPYITGQNSNGFINTTVSNQVQYLQVGFSLNVTPRITRQGQVTIDLVSDASELLKYQQLGTGQAAISAPVTNDRYADTSVTVQDNETIVIGGLIRQSDNVTRVKVPLLGDIPLLGQLFQSKERSHEKVELVIFMTPHVVSSVEEARTLTAKQGASVITQIPDIQKQQPNLEIKKSTHKPTTIVPEKKTDGTITPPMTPDNGSTQNPNIKP